MVWSLILYICIKWLFSYIETRRLLLTTGVYVFIYRYYNTNIRLHFLDNNIPPPQSTITNPAILIYLEYWNTLTCTNKNIKKNQREKMMKYK